MEMGKIEFFLLVLCCYIKITFGMSKAEAVQAAVNRRVNRFGAADDMNFTTTGRSFPSHSKDHMSFEISGVHFPSYRKESFRVRSESIAEGMILNLEKKSTKQRWQINITDIGIHGLSLKNSGIPKETIFSILKKYMEESSSMKNIDQLERSLVSDPTKPLMDIEITKDTCLLILEVPFGGTTITYNFELLPQAVDKFDRLESLLNDALEEIIVLKEDSIKLKADMESFKTNVTRLETEIRLYY